MHFLNKTETEFTLQRLREQFGINFKPEFLFLQNEDKLYITCKELRKVGFENYNINNVGLYFARQIGNKLKPTMEATQIIGKYATKNVLEIGNPNDWLQGKNIKTDEVFKDFVMIKHNNDFLGTGQYTENTILNLIPKNRRIH